MYVLCVVNACRSLVDDVTFTRGKRVMQNLMQLCIINLLPCFKDEDKVCNCLQSVVVFKVTSRCVYCV